ncbi:MAG: hypothetical protein KA248_07975 [Kiritimatiellae bacterium]|nr:hypothetical protein [Kiritimatiellia bacterium]
MIGKIQAFFSNDWKNPRAFFPIIGKRAARLAAGLLAPGLMFLLAFTPGIGLTEDLGRHLLLGRLIVERGSVPDTNLLTYTWPGHPFINHHWLSEAVFYLLHQAFGLNGLIVLKAALMAGVLALAMRTVRPGRCSARYLWTAVPAAVVLGYRAHIRPELFTFLGVAFYGWVFERLRAAAPAPGPGHTLPSVATGGRGGRRAFWPVAGLVLYAWFWANAHIYFIFGLGMAGAYFLERWRARRAWPWPEALGLAALVGVSLLNPSGGRGLLYPFAIFREYALSVVENASPLELWRAALNPMLLALPLLTGLAVAAVFGVTTGRPRDAREPRRLAHVIILLAALAAAWRMARSAPLLALAVLPVAGEWSRRPASSRRGMRWIGLGSAGLAALGLAAAVVEGSYARPFPAPGCPTPFGLDDETRFLALRRLREDGLPGRVFSDYNIGSLVEYNLWPEPGYLDNRPEAFPSSFWREEYYPALGLGEDWERIRRERGIETVAVSLSGVGSEYVLSMMNRPEWKLVHLDFLLAVWVRASAENEPFIRRHLFTRERLEAYTAGIRQRLENLPRRSCWRRAVSAEQAAHELYSLACVGEFGRLWPMAWDLHRRYPDYRLLDDLLLLAAPPERAEEVRRLLARRARWPLAAAQVLTWGAVLESEGRFAEARAVYRRGRWFFPLAPDLASRLRLVPAR